MTPTDTAARAKALLDLIESHRADRCATLEASVRAQAAAIRAEAHATARARMRHAFDDERRLRADRLGAAAAELETRRRAAEQARDAAMLRAAWDALPRALDARWRDPAARSAWIAATTQAAREALPRAPWLVSVAAGIGDAERDALVREIFAITGSPPTVTIDTALASGLVVSVAGAKIDATGEGLLADRADVGARLLDLVQGAAR